MASFVRQEFGQSLTDWDDLLTRLDRIDPELARSVHAALSIEQNKRRAAERQLAKGQPAAYCRSDRTDDLVIRLLASPSMNKTSCVDADELKAVIDFALANPTVMAANS